MTLEALIYAALGECAERTMGRTMSSNKTAHYPEEADGVAHNATDSSSPETAISSYWLVHYIDQDPVEVYTAPAFSHAEIMSQYSSAIAAEPFTPPPRPSVVTDLSDNEPF